jgi:hypothetical protein
MFNGYDSGLSVENYIAFLLFRLRNNLIAGNGLFISESTLVDSAEIIYIFSRNSITSITGKYYGY